MGVTTVFEVDVPASALALAETFERAPALTVELERTVGDGGEAPLRFAWLSGADPDRAGELLAADPTVAGAESLGGDADATLFDVDFEGELGAFARRVFDYGGAVLRATGAEGVWTFRLRFADHGEIGAVFDEEFADEYGATVTRLSGSRESPTGRSRLTRKQRRALEAAFEMGYYAVPRNVDLEAVGRRLDVSRQAVSERLRRAHSALVAERLGETNEEG